MVVVGRKGECFCWWGGGGARAFADLGERICEGGIWRRAVFAVGTWFVLPVVGAFVIVVWLLLLLLPRRRLEGGSPAEVVFSLSSAEELLIYVSTISV